MFTGFLVKNLGRKEVAEYGSVKVLTVKYVFEHKIQNYQL